MIRQPSYLGLAPGDWIAALRSSDSLERRLAAHALAEIGPAARKAAPALIDALRDPESFVRVWAAAALVRVQPDNPDAIPALVAGMRDEISFVRSLAAWHLGRLGPSAARIVLDSGFAGGNAGNALKLGRRGWSET